MTATFTIVSPARLKERLEQTEPLLLLDVRRRESFRQQPMGIRGAVPVLLDADPVVLPDVDRQQDILVYCLCTGQASSTRVAQWLVAAGYQRVSVLAGGLPGWKAAGHTLAPILSPADRTLRWASLNVLVPLASSAAAHGRLIAESAFLAGVKLPARREMAVLFVDMVDSTPLVLSRPPEEVLHLVQAFMEVVVDVAVQHCGDVHDFEGDGAMLYFAGPGESVPAAFGLRQALDARRRREPDLPHARYALDAGPLVLGYVGTRERRALSFIGPSVNRAARILKLAPPDGIIATAPVFESAEQTDPRLAAQFVARKETDRLKGFEAAVPLFVAAPAKDARHG